MADEIVKFDPSKLYEQVKDKVRSAMFDCIPEAQWKQFVAVEYKKFFEGEGSGYSRQNAEFSNLAKLAIREEVAKQLKDYFSSPDWDGKANGQAVGKVIQEFVKEHSAEILSSLLQNSFQAVITNFTIPIQQQLNQVTDSLKQIRGY